MNAKEFKQSSFNAYIQYVALIEGKITAQEAVDYMAPLMAEYGFTLTIENLINVLTVKLTAYGKDKGEQAKKIKSITTFRSFIKGGWAEVSAAPVHSNAGKNPAGSSSKSTKSKGKTKADLEAEIEQLKAMLASQSTASQSTHTGPVEVVESAQG